MDSNLNNTRFAVAVKKTVDKMVTRYRVFSRILSGGIDAISRD